MSLLCPISIKSNTVSDEFNTIGLLFPLFDITTKSPTQLFAKSLFTSINKTDIKTIDTTLNILGDMNHDNEYRNEYDYNCDMNLFKQNLDMYFNSSKTKTFRMDCKSTYYGNKDWILTKIWIKYNWYIVGWSV